MKTSNKILIGLLTGIFLIMTAMFIDIRVFGLSGDERFTKNYTEDFPLEKFDHVVIENSNTIYLEKSTDRSIRFTTISDTIKYNLKHKISGDTLYIAGSKLPVYANNTLFFNSDIKSITLKHASARLSGFSQDSIRIDMSDGEINYNYNENSEFNPQFKYVSIVQMNSVLRFENMKVDVLDIDMFLSEARFDRQTFQVNAKIYSGSELNLNNVSKLNLEKDDSSKIRFW